MKYLLILTLFTTQAYANPHPHEEPNEPTTQTETTVETIVEVSPVQTAINKTEVTDGDVETRVEINRASNAGDYTMRRVAPLVLGSGNTTAPCYRWFGFGLGTKDGNTGIGYPFSDKQCMALKRATFLVGIGSIEAAIIEYCSAEWRTWLFKRNYMWTPYGSLKNCKTTLSNIVPRETKEVLDAESDERSTPAYDATAFREEVEAALSAVREELRQTKVKIGAAQKRSAAPHPDVYTQQVKVELSKVAMVE